MHRYDLNVENEGSGKRLLLFLRQNYPLAPERVFQSALKLRDIKVNGERTAENLVLMPGDSVTWFTPWAMPDLPIIYEDELILIINKPAGISTDRQEDGAISVEEWAEGYHALIVHRLDQQTTGLLILAKNEEIKGALEDAFRLGQIVKRYQCLVSGMPSPRHAILQAYLRKDAAKGKVRIFEHPVKFAKEIVTEYDVLEAKDGTARLLVTLHTGRTHQIRAHLAHMGHPLLGDDKYGSREDNRRFKARRLMLCSTELRFHTQGMLASLNERSFEIKAPF